MPSEPLLVAIPQVLVEDIKKPLGLHAVAVDGVLNPQIRLPSWCS